MIKKLVNLLLFLLPCLHSAAEEQTIYTGPKAVSNWQGISIAASTLAEVGTGDVVRVYVTSLQGSDKSGTAGFLTADGSALYPSESQFKIYGDYSLIVSNSVVSILRSSGLTISGHGYTINKVTLEKDPRTKLLFQGSVDIAYYQPTISIPSFQFQTARVGDVIQVEVSNLNADSRGCLQNSDWDELKVGYSGFELKGSYSMTIDENVLVQLQNGALRVRGAYHTVNSIKMYCPSSGFDVDPDEKRDAPMMFGLNESGGEFAGVYPGIDGTHYGYPNYDDLAYAKRKGFGIIRLPFRWERVQRPLGSNTLIQNEVRKIKQVLDWATQLNLRVIFDMHNFGRYCTYCNGSNSNNNVYAIIGESTCTLDHFCQVWRLLAQEFKDYECIWAYEIMNEPYAMLSSLPWVQIAQAAIYAIREIDTVTPILVDGDSFASARNWQSVSDNLRTLNDPADNLIFSSHCYFDHDSSGEYSRSYDNSGANAQTGVTRLKPFVDWCNRYGKRGFVGEYGVPDDDSRWLTVLENALNYLKDNGMGGTYWSAGHRWGDYSLAVHPTNNYTTDRPQMAVLEKFGEEGTATVLMDNNREPITNDRCYNLLGQKTENRKSVNRKSSWGIYIQNGRKRIK